MPRRPYGIRNATVAEAMTRPMRLGATVGNLTGRAMTPSGGIEGVFAPDVALPAQYLRRRSLTELQPERRLMLAVLEDALELVRSPRTTLRDGTRDEARRWIESDDTAWPFAFRRICEVLGLDAGAIRRRVREPRFRTLAKERRVEGDQVELLRA